jgi:hypothetical protein
MCLEITHAASNQTCFATIRFDFFVEKCMMVFGSLHVLVTNVVRACWNTGWTDDDCFQKALRKMKEVLLLTVRSVFLTGSIFNFKFPGALNTTSAWKYEAF